MPERSCRRLSSTPPGGSGRLPGAAQICAAATVALLGAASTAGAATINVIDVIPVSQSAEAGQNSEPSLGVNPVDPTQMISGAFSSSFSCSFNCGTPNELDTVASPYWKSTDGGHTWSDFGSIQSVDKSISWSQKGLTPLALTTPLSWGDATGNTQIQTFQGTTAGANFGAAVETFNPGRSLDQPWIRTGPGGQTYVTYNDLSNAGGQTASIRVSTNDGNPGSYAVPITLEKGSPAGGQDAPSVRSAVNGSTVYAAFTRWGAGVGIGPNQAIFPGSEVVVVKSLTSGSAGSFSTGVTAATTTGYFANASNTPLTLGQERTGSDVAIAVDPTNANRVVVAYGNANGTGLLQLNVVESTDGGATWSPKFSTSTAVRSGLPALSILQNGAVGLLYESYDPTADVLSQHLVTTTDDFATTSDTLLGTQSNKIPVADFFPYVGDFFDLTSLGNTLYGIFSASNADNGSLASFPDATFQRDFTGVPGTGTFALTSSPGGPVVGFSVDPFVFSQTISITPTPEPATLSLLGAGLLGLAALRRRRR